MTHEQAVRTMASERYLLDEMSELERYQFEAHYFECEECADDVRTGAAIRDEVKAGGVRGAAAPSPMPAIAPAAVPAPAARTTTRGWKTVVPWAVAATLAVMIGYESLTPRPGGAPDAAQVLSPVVLRGASRGADTVVPLAGGPVAVSVDVIAGAGVSELAYALLGADGATVISGRTPAPPSGAPLLLLIPADRLVPAGRFTLVVRDAVHPDVAIGEYPFIVSGTDVKR